MRAKTFQHPGAASLLVSLGAFLAVSTAGAQTFSDWSAPVDLNQLPNQQQPINSVATDQHPAISKNGLSLYFSSDRTPGGCGGMDIWVTQRASLDSPWEEPFNLGCAINSSANDLAPNLSTNGHLLFFHSFRSGGCGGGDVYYAHRQHAWDDTGWEAPRNLNRFGLDPQASLPCGEVGSSSFVNTPMTDAGPNYFQDDATGATLLYFTRSDQPTMLGDFDIYLATLAADGTWGTVTRDDQLSSPYRDTRTAIRRRDGLEMILSSERSGGLGNPSRDLWVSTRSSTQDPWAIPVPLPNVNSTALDGGPAISWDGTELYFTSNRTDPGGAGGSDLYLSTRTKITGP